MGLIDFLKGRATRKSVVYASTTQGTPAFSQFGMNIMNDETVFAITNRILDEYSKLNPRHIRVVNGRQVKVTDNNINNILQYPNNRTTRVDFLRKCAYLREKYKNCFIYPCYDLYYNPTTGRTKKVYKALYPLHPVQVDFYEDELGIIYVDFTFRNGEHSGNLRYDEIIHWMKDYSENEFMGGDINGMPNNSTLLKHLETNDKLLQATFKSIEGSLRINGIIKLQGLIGREKVEKERLDFEKKLDASENGFLALDTGSDYVPIPYNGRTVSQDVLKFYDNKSRRHYGVSEAILDGDFTSDQFEAFYSTALESGVISLGLAMERVLLTPFERANGNKIICYTSEIQMMSAEKKIKLAELLLPVGGVSPNEIRDWFGIMPYEGGDERVMSLNWIKASNATQYQIGNDSNSENNDKNVSNSDIIDSVNDTTNTDEEVVKNDN